MTFQFEYSARDFAYLYRRPTNSLGNSYFYALWFAAVVSGVIFLRLNWDKVGYVYLLLFVAAPFIQWTQPRYLRKNLLLSPSLKGMRTLDVNDQQMRLTHETFSAQYSWSYFMSYQENRDVFLLFPSKIAALVIPKAIMSEAETNSFRELLHRKLPVSGS